MEIKINPRKSFTTIIAFIYLFSGITLLMFRYDLAQEYKLPIVGIIIGALILLSFALFYLFYLYLGGNLKINVSQSMRYSNIDNQFKNEQKRFLGMDEITYRIEKLESKIAKYNYQNTSITESDKNNIVEDIKNSLKNNLNHDLLAEIDNKYSENILSAQKIELVISDFDKTTKRIIEEIYALSRRANINLIIGSFTTLVAVGILIYWVFSNNNQFDTLTKLLSSYIPRISIIIFVELFAYFFLKLYKDNLHDIKYYQNELTNIEGKFAALRSSITFNMNDSKEYVIKGLSDTERNILRGEQLSTEDLEKIKLKNSQINKLFETINKSIKSIKN